MPTSPNQCGSALQGFHRPLPLGSEALHCRSCTAHCLRLVRHCIARVPLSTAPRHCGGALQEYRYLGNNRFATQLLVPPAGGPRIAKILLPTIPKRCGNALQELHCPLPLGSKAVRCGSSTAHRPRAVGHCVT